MELFLQIAIDRRGEFRILLNIKGTLMQIEKD